MHRGIRHGIAPNQLVLLVDIHMILIAIVMVPMLDRPTGVDIFLPAFGWVRLPLGGTLARFNRRVCISCIPLLRDRDQ